MPRKGPDGRLIWCASEMLKLYGQLGKPSRGPKTKTASKVYGMLRDTKPVKVRGYKTEDYSGFLIRIYPELVEGSGVSCHIYSSKLGEAMANRRGIDAAHKYIDDYLASLRGVPFKPRRKTNDECTDTSIPSRKFPTKPRSS